MTAAALAERHLVGAVLWLPAAEVRTAAEVVPAEWIDNMQVRAVYSAAVGLAAAGLAPEPALIVPKMLQLGLPEQKNHSATALVVDLYASCPLPGNWRFYAVTVAAQYVRNRVRQIGQALVGEAHSASLDRLLDLLEDGRQQIEATNGHVQRIGGTVA
jgi:hypothetical protein